MNNKANRNPKGFLMLNRGTALDTVIKKPHAFVLITQIALRARRTKTDFNPHNLNIGEAFVGDCKEIGLKESQYRSAKKWLSDHHLVLFKGTNRGTVAKLLNDWVFDINEKKEHEQTESDLVNKFHDYATNNKKENNNIINNNAIPNGIAASPAPRKEFE